MRNRSRQFIRGIRAKTPVSHAGISTVVLLCAGFFWSLIQLFTTVNMSCATYYYWLTDESPANNGILSSLMLIALAMAAYLFADNLRPKTVRRSLVIRAFQILLVFVIFSATLVQYGIVMPNSSIAPLARRVELAFAYAGVGVFVYPELEYGLDPFWIPENPTPTINTSAYPLYSPFAIKAGVLRCEVDAQVEDLQQEQARNYWESARPFAITEERR